jgi:hypothetical protein
MRHRDADLVSLDKATVTVLVAEGKALRLRVWRTWDSGKHLGRRENKCTGKLVWVGGPSGAGTW